MSKDNSLEEYEVHFGGYDQKEVMIRREKEAKKEKVTEYNRLENPMCKNVCWILK